MSLTKLPEWNHFFRLDTDVGHLSAKYNKAYRSAWCKHEVRALMEKKNIAQIAAMQQIRAISGERARLHSHLKGCAHARARLADLPDCGLPNYGERIKDGTQSAPSSSSSAQVTQTTLNLVRSQYGLSQTERSAFELELTEAAFAANMPAEAFDSPALRRVLDKWFKFPLPTARVVRGRLLSAVSYQTQGALHDAAQGQEATLCADSWNSPRRDHLVASVICLSGIVVPISVIDTTEQRHTGAAFLDHLKTALKESEGPRFEARITAVCTDAGSDCASARRQLLEERPDIVSIHCFAHQINLLVSDVLKASVRLKTTYVEMLEVVDWFRNHLAAQGILRQYARSNSQDSRSQKTPLSLKRPETTRWTSGFNTAYRLMQLRDHIEGAVLSKRQDLELAAGRRPDAIAKARRVLSRVRQVSFWDSLQDLISILEPLAIAAQVAQTNLCRLDHALLTFGKLYTHYHAMAIKESNSDQVRAACRSLKGALDRRWMACDQHVWMTAVILNPFFGRKLVAISLEGIGMNHAGYLHQIVIPLYLRLFTKEDSQPLKKEKQSLSKDWMAYSSSSGNFADSFFSIQQKLDSKDHDPVALWEEWGAAG